MAIKEKPEMFEEKKNEEMFEKKKGIKVWIIKNLPLLILIGSVVGLGIALATSDLRNYGSPTPGTLDADNINPLLGELSSLQKDVKTLDDKLTSFRNQYLDNRQSVVRNMQFFSNFISTESELRASRAEQLRLMSQKIRNIEEYLNVDREYRQIYQGDVREIRQDLRELIKTLMQIERNLPTSHKQDQ